MRNRVLGAVVISITLAWAATRAQDTPRDAQTVLANVVQAMGADDLKAVRYVGSGFYFAFGQNYSPEEPWPRFRMERYDRLVNYEQMASREEIVRTQAESPARGGGNQPLVGIQQQVFSVSQDAAWNESATLPSLPERNGGISPLPEPSKDAVAAPAVVAERKQQIWMTPHGFVKAAMTHEVTLSTQTQRRRQMTLLSFTMEDGTPVTGTINDQNQVERVETRNPNPVLGDMLVQYNFLNYRDFNGVPFPTQILVSQGGFETLEVLITELVVNPTDRLVAPQKVREAKIEPPHVVVQPVAEGLWFLTGGSHNSVAVEFRDFVAVIEAPLDEARSQVVIDEVHRLAPRKPIKYVINTHHHFDHSGGLRTYVAEGATVITHESNRRFFDLVFAADRKLYPDRLSKSDQHASMETVMDRYIVRNGARIMEIHLVEGSLHDQGLLMVYLPRERLLVEADAFSPSEPGAAPSAAPNSFTVNLYENVQRLKLDVVQVAPIHGRLVPWAEVLKSIGKPGEQEPDGMLHASR